MIHSVSQNPATIAYTQKSTVFATPQTNHIIKDRHHGNRNYNKLSGKQRNLCGLSFVYKEIYE
jgi:hypothetical protein